MGEKRNNGLLLAGMILGALAGAAVTLFLVPKRGEETREQLKAKGIELTGMARRAPHLLQRSQTMMTETAEQAREAIEDIAQAAKQRATETIGYGEDKVREASPEHEQTHAPS